MGCGEGEILGDAQVVVSANNRVWLLQFSELIKKMRLINV